MRPRAPRCSRRLAPFALGALLLAGCSFTAELDDEPIEARRCGADGSCPEGLVCDPGTGFCAPRDGADTSSPGDTSADTTEPGDTGGDTAPPEDTAGDTATPPDTSADTGADTSMPPDTTADTMPPMCQGNEQLCGAECVDTNDNAAHCGGCDMPCGANETCQGGQCQGGMVCGGGETDCGGTCVDTAVDPQHCGGCDIACATNAVCGTGTCTCGSGGGAQSGCHLALPNVADAMCTGAGGKTCSLMCADGFSNSDGDYTNGCETQQ